MHPVVERPATWAATQRRPAPKWIANAYIAHMTFSWHSATTNRETSEEAVRGIAERRSEKSELAGLVE